MRIMRTLFWVLLVLLVAGGAVIGVVTVRGMGAVEEIETSIREHRANLESVEKERAELSEAVRLERERLSEIPDSLAGTKSGAAMRSSMSFAKMETIIDGKEMRSRRSLEHLEKEKEQVKGRLISWNIKLGVIELVLLGALIGLRRAFR
ncbi:MAG: hypothetical protein JSW58_03245 [Candidatus Latescibacterota bacterium]|nr:MAG: hypothetical protein JSW58_03245 [Candidatus Latescibacterota bacterium]